MKRNIKGISKVLMAGLGLLLIESSCTKNFEKYNTDPRALNDSTFVYDGENVGGYFPNMEKSVFHTDDWQFQVQQNLNADIFSGYMMSGDPFSGGINNTNYAIDVSDANGWNNIAFDLGFQQVMAGWYQINLRAAKTRPDLAAVATIIKVEAMHRVTDIYGPMPYTKFGQGTFSSTYDDQKTIYESFFKELDDAITALGAYVQANPGANPFAPYDNVFNGDYKEWLKFANSLRLRLAIRVSMVEPALAKTEAEKSVKDPNGLMITNNDNAYLQANNGLTFVNGLWVCSSLYTDIQLGAPMECYLKGYSDPRLPAFALANSKGGYHGIRNGIDIGANGDYADASFINIGQYEKIKWMTASETAFNLAEGALRGWDVGGSAQSFYEQGITLSFQQFGVPLGSYLSDNTSIEAPYVDLVKAAYNEAAGSPNLSTITIKWDETDTYQHKLERIITQKWIAGWPDGEEAWSEFRRTNYPKLLPVIVNHSPNNSIPSALFIRRLDFSADEKKNNAAEVQKAVSLLGGPDNGATRLWWDLPVKN